MKICVIVPTYNEKENITDFLSALTQNVSDAHILIVDDSSPDGTAAVARKIAEENKNIQVFVRPEKNGLGRAYIDALELVLDAAFDIVVMMDADFSHAPADVPRLISALDTADVAIGSRYIVGGRTEGWELWRRLLSWGGNVYTRCILRIGIADCTSGFYAVRTPTLRKIDFSKLQSSGYAFQIEFKYFLKQADARLVEIPIVFRNRKNGESKISNHIITEGLLAPFRVWFQ